MASLIPPAGRSQWEWMSEAILSRLRRITSLFDCKLLCRAVRAPPNTHTHSHTLLRTHPHTESSQNRSHNPTIIHHHFPTIIHPSCPAFFTSPCLNPTSLPILHLSASGHPASSAPHCPTHTTLHPPSLSTPPLLAHTPHHHLTTTTAAACLASRPNRQP